MDTNNNIRYRTEEAFGDGYRDILDVMTYETYNLANNDLLMYFLRTYKDADSTVREQARKILASYEGEEHVDFGEADIREFFAAEIKELERLTGKRLRYCLWLAEKDTVKEYYMQGGPCTVDGYPVSDVVLTDLGYDGTLYAYEQLPEAVSHEFLSD